MSCSNRKRMFLCFLVAGLITGSKSHDNVHESSMSTGAPLNLCRHGQPGSTATDSSGLALIFASIFDAYCTSPLSNKALDVSSSAGTVECEGVVRTDPSGRVALVVPLSKTSTSEYLGGSLRFCLNETVCGLDRRIAEPKVVPPGSDRQVPTGVVEVRVCVGRGSSRVQRSVGVGVFGSGRSRFAFTEKGKYGGGEAAPKSGSIATRRSGEEENDWDKIPMEWIKRGKSQTRSLSRSGKNLKGKKSRIVRDLERIASSTESKATDGNLSDFLASPEVQRWKNEMEKYGKVAGSRNNDLSRETVGVTVEKNYWNGNNLDGSRQAEVKLGISKKWDDSGMAWIKKNADKRWDDSGMAWMKRNAGKRWDDSGMAWIKKDADKRWDDSGMAWIKKNTDKRWDDSGMAWMKKDANKKWDDSGMAWIKKDANKKWDDSGMAWMKKDADKKWDDSGMAWIKKDADKKWDDSGMAWMKKDADKKWDDSGMAWIKKDADKKWDDSGMAWMKRDSDKKWDDSGMAWMKKDTDKKWDDSGMAWIKKNTDEKWDDSGIALVKRNADKEWEDVGLTWMKKSVAESVPDLSRPVEVTPTKVLLAKPQVSLKTAISGFRSSVNSNPFLISAPRKHIKAEINHE